MGFLSKRFDVKNAYNQITLIAQSNPFGQHID